MCEYKIIDGTHCKYNGSVYHIAQLTVEMIANLKANGCKFTTDNRFFIVNDSYVINVGNIGNCFETSDLQVAISHYEEYCKLSKSGYGSIAGEPVAILCNGEPMESYEYIPVVNCQQELLDHCNSLVTNLGLDFNDYSSLSFAEMASLKEFESIKTELLELENQWFEHE